MTYAAEDEQPSIFLLKEDRRQSILTVFNWTDGRGLIRSIIRSGAAGRRPDYVITDILDANKTHNLKAGMLDLDLPAHSVRVLKIVD